MGVFPQMKKARRGLILGLAALRLSAQDFSETQRRITDFTLPNGLHWVVMERHEAPVIAFHIYVESRVGG